MEDSVKAFKDWVHGVLFKLRTLRSNISIFLSRAILKNEGGLDLFLIGKCEHFFKKLLCKEKKQPAAITDKNQNVVPFLHKNKYAPVSLELPPELVKEIHAKVCEYIEDDQFSYVRGAHYGNSKDQYYTRAMRNVVTNIPQVREVLTPELESILTEYFDTNIGVTSVLLWRNYHVPEDNENRIVFSNDWHNDNIAPTELKLFVNITDVTENHGPLHVISEQESKRLFSEKAFKGRKKQNDVSSLENSEHLIKHTGKAGSAVLAHASCCLHRADIPGEGNYRDMLEFQFHPTTAPLSEDWYTKRLKYQ